MSRQLRVEFPGAIYHVTNRGNRDEAIFRDDADRERFLKTLGEACGKTGWQVHAYGLMPSHFHLVIETPQPNLVVGIKWFLGTYTARFNRRHRLSGHLFGGRYRALPVAGAGGYLRRVCDYVHLNPARAQLVSPQAPLRAYAWTSLPAYLARPEDRPAWLRTDRLLEECGLRHDSPAGRRALEQRLEDLREPDSEADFTPIRRGWFFGDEPFRLELLSRMEPRLGRHCGAEVQALAENKAVRVVAEELQRLSMAADDLERIAKGDERKLRIALRLRAETTMTLAWIARRLHMGAPTHLSHLLYWHGRPKPRRPRTLARRLTHPARPPETAVIEAEPFNPAFD